MEIVKRSDVGAVRALLGQSHADVNAREADGSTALHWAAEQDNAEITALLIKAGADVKAATRFGITPLLMALLPLNTSRLGTPSMVQLLALLRTPFTETARELLEP